MSPSGLYVSLVVIATPMRVHEFLLFPLEFHLALRIVQDSCVMLGMLREILSGNPVSTKGCIA